MVDVVAPLAVSKGVARTIPVAEGSAALEASAILPGANMVAAFQSVSAHDLHAPILKLMGFDHKKLTYRYAGRDFRLTDVAGHVVDPILS